MIAARSSTEAISNGRRYSGEQFLRDKLSVGDCSLAPRRQGCTTGSRPKRPESLQ